MVDGIGATVFPLMMTLLKVGLWIFIAGIVIAAGVFIIIELKRRKWHIRLKEVRDDGTLHTVKHDILIERKLNKGMTTIYWLKKTKVEVIPPPEECVERWKGKDYVTYLKIGVQDYIPMSEGVNVDFKNPETNKKLSKYYKRILGKVRAIKTTFFDSEPVRDRFVYIPCKRTLAANYNYKPIDYDMSMMAQNKINHADEFFKMKGEWWAKYGAYILFGVTIVFLIIITVLTFEFIANKIADILSAADRVASPLERIAGGLGGGESPPPN